MQQQLFKKPKGKRYVDLCIDIDNEFYTENVDLDKMYIYMWLLAYMLACKKRYFDCEQDYEDFASYLAYDVFARMSNGAKGEIKSVLNYMKSILNFRRMSFEAFKHQEIFDAEWYDKWDSTSIINNYRSTIESTNRERLVANVEDIISAIPGMINKSIPKVYRNDKLLFKNVYNSSLLSLLNKFTLPASLEQALSDRINSPNFNEIKFYKKHLKGSSIILWHLPKSMESIVTITINKVYTQVSEEINSLISDYSISDDNVSTVLAAELSKGGSNEAD